jgi:hypothetical protein
MRKGRILFITLVSISLFSSSALAQKVVDAVPQTTASIMGSIEGRTYINKLLKFELTLPEDGVILNQAETEVYKNAGVENLRNGKNDAQLDSAVQKERILLNYARKPLGSPGNSILVIGAMKENAGVTTPIVVAATLRALSASGKFELLKSLTGIGIGGLKADGLEGTITASNGTKVKERILIVVRNGYAIGFTLSAVSDEGINSAQDLLSTLRFFKQ